MNRVALVVVALALGGCGSSASTDTTSLAAPRGAQSVASAHPQVVEPNVGDQAVTTTGQAPVGDVNAHAPPLSQVRGELRTELISVSVTDAHYIDPLAYVTRWERTDQGVDAALPIGAPILAPCRVKILAIIPDWFAGQPLVYFELLDGPDAGRIQYVAEQITQIARPGTVLTRGQTIAQFAKSGTDIEYGWSTPNGITLAVATTGYEEGEVTPAGRAMRTWLNTLGAGAGNS
jgi:hypothetical protein